MRGSVLDSTELAPYQTLQGEASRYSAGRSPSSLGSCQRHVTPPPHLLVPPAEGGALLAAIGGGGVGGHAHDDAVDDRPRLELRSGQTTLALLITIRAGILLRGVGRPLNCWPKSFNQ